MISVSDLGGMGRAVWVGARRPDATGQQQADEDMRSGVCLGSASRSRLTLARRTALRFYPLRLGSTRSRTDCSGTRSFSCRKSFVKQLCPDFHQCFVSAKMLESVKVFR